MTAGFVIHETISISTWQRWEKGGVYPDHRQLEKMALGVDVSAGELGLRYARALLCHYQGRASSGGEGIAEVIEDPGSPPASHVGEAATAAAPRVRGFRSHSGGVWVDVADLLSSISELRPRRPVRSHRRRRPSWSRRKR